MVLERASEALHFLLLVFNVWMAGWMRAWKVHMGIYMYIQSSWYYIKQYRL